MTNHYPLTNTVFSELNRFVNHALSGELAECDNDSCDTRVSKEIEAISNDTDGWKLRLALPGYTKDEVQLSVDEHFLTIAAETEDEERSFLGKEQRRVRISDDVDSENIQAKLENGILFLKIPRRVKAEPKKIVVN